MHRQNGEVYPESFLLLTDQNDAFRRKTKIYCPEPCKRILGQVRQCVAVWTGEEVKAGQRRP